MTKARFAWHAKATGKVGCGELIEKASAEAWAEKLNKDYKGIIYHWVQVAKVDEIRNVLGLSK